MRRLLATLALCLSSVAAFSQTIIPTQSLGGGPIVTTSTAHQFLTSYPTLGGALVKAQPAFTDISGSLATTQCPAGTTSSIGCLEVGGGLSVSAGIVQMATLAGTAHQFVSSINSSGVPLTTQPVTADINSSAITGLVLSSSGSLSAYAGSSCSGSNFVSAISASGVATCAIPGSSTGVVLGANGGTGVANTGDTITLGGNITTGGVITTTGTGPTTLAFPSSSTTYTFPSGGGTLVTTGANNLFTQPQTINTNATSFPTLPTPFSLLNMVASDGTQGSATILSTAAQSYVRLGRADGTLASKTALVNTDVIGNYGFIGWDGSAWSGDSTKVRAVATGSWSPSDHEAQVQIGATPTSSTTFQVEATYQNGVALGTGTPQGLGTENAPNGFYVGSTSVVSSGRAGNLTSLNINNNTVAFPATRASSTLNILAADGVTNHIDIMATGTGVGASTRFWHANGSFATSLSTTVSPDTLGSVNMGGWDGTAWSTAQVIVNGQGTDTWNTGDHGAELVIQTTANGTTATQVDAIIHGGIASGNNTPQGIGTVNAVNGYYVGSTNVISSLGAGIFPGGLNSAVSTGTPVASLCLDASNNIIKKTTTGSCI
jgi:hypothetical protein